MRWWPRPSSRVAPTDGEIARELRDHLELEAEELGVLGATRAQSGLEARRRFGNVGQIQEDVRDTWGNRWIERMNEDLRFGLRTLRRTPVYTTIAVTCLALGIGANAAVLGWTDGILRHPFPGVHDQDRLVAIAGTVKGASGYEDMSWPDFMDLAKGTTAFSAFIVSKVTSTTLTGGDRAERLIGQLVSANYFDAVGVRPIVGRGFVAGEDVGAGAHPVTVISYRLWQDRFHGSPGVVDSTVGFNGVLHTIIGIAPPTFLGTFVGYPMQFWVPASQQAVFDPSGYRLADRSARWIEGFARLAPNVRLAAAQAQVDAVTRRLELEFPNDNRGRGARVVPLDQNPWDIAQELAPMLRVGSVVAAIVLLIVCANIANLLLVRAMARRSELTVRRALGASRPRLIRQLLTEGLILAIAGTGLGVIAAYLSRNMLGLFFPPRGGVTLVFASDFNWRVIVLSVAIGIASTLLFALAPALQSTRLNLAGAMRAAAPGAIGTGTRSHLRSILVLVQVSLSVVLLVGAGLMMRSFRRLLVEDPGFSTANTITTSVNLMAAGYDTARAHRFQDDLLQRTRAISGVSGVAIARSQPLSTRPYDNGPIATDDYAPSRDERPTADYNAVTPEYFATLGIPVLAGRDFGSADAVTSAPVAIVSRALAQRYWPNASPIGKRLRLRTTWMQVVGVVGDIKYRSLTQTPGMLFYVPLAQLRPTAVGVFIRTAQDNSASIAPEVLRAIHAIDQNVSPYEIVSLREQVSRSTAGPRIVVVLLMLFSGVALVLAAIGLYGVLAYMISQSTRELGVRMALGASPSQVVRLVVSSGLRLTFPGIVIGVVVGLGTTRLLGDLLFRVGPRDPVVFAAVVGVMTFASLVACSLPGWRASRLDPVRALRA